MKFQCTMCDKDKNTDAFPSDAIPGDPAICWECAFPLMVGAAVLGGVVKEQDRVLSIAQALYEEKRISVVANMMLVSRTRNI